MRRSMIGVPPLCMPLDLPLNVMIFVMATILLCHSALGVLIRSASKWIIHTATNGCCP
nr:MAG TPA: hypothetical protein [Caudoviricetes sp.]